MVKSMKIKQNGFTLIELMVTIILALLLMNYAMQVYSSSISENKALNLISSLKTDLEWARNQALSENHSIIMVVPTNNVCNWSFTDNGIQVMNHTMTSSDLILYKNVSCAFVNPTPSFNGLGININGDTKISVSALNTTRNWVLNVQGSGDVILNVN
jgi:prepilin-type N-terminal cleavage/methylation domain-containing protein